MYEAEIAHFADRFRVLSYDYPGRGQSTREQKYADERAFDQWNHWSDLACHLLLALKVASAYVMGVGGGARAALFFAGHHAPMHNLITKGVLADSFLADLDMRTFHRSLDVREHFYVRNHRALQLQHGDDWRQVVDDDTAYLRAIASRGGYALPEFVLNSVRCPVLLTGH
ncbi:MAG: alpha/beta hydrolase [Chloroflexi bacterium]|nr:alpha/beta hydrolase [Chloroflexota bacterium]